MDAHHSTTGPAAPAPLFRLGIDVGSTTAKIVLLDPAGQAAFSAYRRHYAETQATLGRLLEEVRAACGDVVVTPRLTGSAGLGLSERLNLPFIQEVIASAEVARQAYPQVSTLLDIGGEDAKLIFFNGPDGRRSQPDIRMNGACAGGTGAFIDQMATLLNIEVGALEALAERHTTIYPIASRCGVFAKTDVQNLLSRDARPEDIAASIFHAVVLQTLATLARGRTLSPVILFAGGPLTFLPALKTAFVEALHLTPDDWLEIEHPELIPAHGAALASADGAAGWRLSALMERLAQQPAQAESSGRMAPLFLAGDEFERWEAARAEAHVARVDPLSVAGRDCFLGIDSGSTTTKVVLVDEQGRLVFEHYGANHGNAIGAAQAGLEGLRQLVSHLPQPPRIARSAVTGYGEDLIRAAFGCDEGLVETLAHFRAARAFDPQVSFILDIGGQDMKAIFVQDGHIRRIDINEACSSGCGTFLETFANSLGRTAAVFGREACAAGAPCDLGTRCTVFMNSRVKQALREGASIPDISAGLAYSVIRNALHKVLKLTDTGVLGGHIVVQGGAFRNPAIHKALEQILGRPVVCPDKAELMGAYGAALAARDAYEASGAGAGLGFDLNDPAALDEVASYRKQMLRCRACENQCAVTKLTFPNRNIFYTGNRCERIYSNRGKRLPKGANLIARKRELLFDRPTTPAAAPQLTIGIPRALNLYENYPFWCTLLVECGFRVQLSSTSSPAVFEKGAATVMSENICFPAKLLHGHVFDLIEAGVDRIFYPMVFYERREFADAVNCYNCPVVSGYPDVVRSAIDPAGRYGIPFDQPAVTFQDEALLRKDCRAYLLGLGVPAARFERAFGLALAAQAEYKTQVRAAGAEVVEQAKAEGRLVVVMAGRPYHIDSLVNHKLPEVLADLGVDVISEDCVPLAPDQTLDNPMVLTQWAYLNRCYHAARWVREQPDVELVQLNSFGCGPDAFALEEVQGLLAEAGKHHTVIRIDEIDSLGSARLRLRSMLETRRSTARESGRGLARRTTRLYVKDDRRKLILVPEFSEFCTPPIVRPLIDQGYRFAFLPSPDQESVQVGLKYTNNEICYPGIIVIGDILKALQSGQYDPNEVVAGSWETGGQCRASNISCLLKKSLVAAGFGHVPVVTISTRLRSFNPQPGFRLNIAQYVYRALLGMAYTDGLSALYHATVARERTAGDAQTLVQQHLAPFTAGTMPLTRSTIFDGLRAAVRDFNRVGTHTDRRPQVGLVGEVYVKYNRFVNHDLAHWLMAQGMDVVLPPLLTFFLGSYVGHRAGVEAGIRRPDWISRLLALTRGPVTSLVGQVEAILQRARHYHPRHTEQQAAESARAVLHLTHQYGEGWLLAGEVGEYAKAGVRNVICLQPFGCIANHVIAKGVSRRMQAVYPDLNLLFLDLDHGISEVNYLNRLHFFVEQARAPVYA
jgi:predicted CoA-substrate-specific enzyme activase